MIPLSAPELRGNEWKYLKECLDSGWVSSAGSFVNRFEREFAAATGRRYAVATVNGASALHIALLVAGIQPDDEVLVSDLTFIAPVNAIRYVSARPVLVDSDADTWQMDTRLLRDFFAERAGSRRVKAILPVGILGASPDIRAIAEIAREHGLVVVEDATEALGSDAGRHSDIACFSFNGNKLITTGGGGMIVTDREDWAVRARHLSTQAKQDPVEYVHDEIGYNYRLSNLAAALGCAQLELLNEFVAAKRTNAARYRSLLTGVPGIAPMPVAPCHAYWLYTVLVNEQEYGISSRDLLLKLSEAGAQARPLWEPMHRSQPHRNSRVLGGVVADRLYREGLSLPSSAGLKPEELERVVKVIADQCR